MAETVGMPRLSDSMEEGTVLKWLVEEGGEVKRGEPLVEIETDKANMTYEADTDGVLIKVIANEGDTLPVGDPIAEIGDEGEAPSGGGDETGEGRGARGEDEAGAGRGRVAGEETRPSPRRGQARRKRAKAVRDRRGGPAGPGAAQLRQRRRAHQGLPVARRMAGELGVELARLEGSGPGGRIVKADVESAAEDGGAADRGGGGAGRGRRGSRRRRPRRRARAPRARSRCRS